MTEAPAWLVRPARRDDMPALLALAEAVGPGMTTLPPDAGVIADKLDVSEKTFAGKPAEGAQYILVLEDVGSGRVLGLSALYPHVGDRHGFFSYKRTRLVQRSELLGRRIDIELLTLSNDYTGSTEVGSLVVLPALRGTGAGRLLARSRYMLIAAFPDLFAERVMAEMRGWQDETGQSPFWDAIGARFFDMSFEEADRLSATAGVGFIADLMPKQPIYTALLPEGARNAIGRPHRQSAKAMAMLLEEDFHYEDHVDVFDGGPQIHAARDKIRTVMDSRPIRLAASARGAAQSLLLSNTELENFRVMEAQAELVDGVVALGETLRRGLNVMAGDNLRAAPGRKIKTR